MRRSWLPKLVLSGLAVSGLAAVAMGAMRPSPPQSPPAATPSQPVVLVELFTSEGCSDCPPADRMLQQIDGKLSPQGVLVVGVSEHITYWDHDGWKDPYGSDLTTARQQDYVSRFHLDSPYTPQMVLNGESQFVGGNTQAFTDALDKAHPLKSSAVKISALKLDGDIAHITVSIGDDLPPRGADLVLVTAEDETTQRVLAGENSGKTLSHTSVARTLQRINRVRQVGDSTYDVKLPKPDSGSKRHLIVWLQEPGLGRIIGVDTQPF